MQCSSCIISIDIIMDISIIHHHRNSTSTSVSISIRKMVHVINNAKHVRWKQIKGTEEEESKKKQDF